MSTATPSISNRPVLPAPILPPGAVPGIYAEERLVGYWRAERAPGDCYDAERIAVEEARLAEMRETGRPPFVVSGYGREGMEAYFVEEIARLRERVEIQGRLPWPGDHCDPGMPEEERERVAAALEAGEVLAEWRGSSWDRLGRGALGSRCLGRAGFRWPEGLAHYVRRYGLRLPPEFLEAIGGK